MSLEATAKLRAAVSSRSGSAAYLCQETNTPKVRGHQEGPLT